MITDVAALFLTGLVSLFGQIVLLRELSVVFSGIELIYFVALGIWMLTAAAGALLGSRRPSTGRIGFLFICFAIFLPIDLLFLRASGHVLGGTAASSLPFTKQIAALLIALLPAGLISGLLFREAAGLHAERNRTLAGAHGIGSAGGAIGGLLATIGLRYGIQNFPLAIACALISIAAALFLFRGNGNRSGRFVAIVLTTALIAILQQSSALDRRMTGWNHPGLVATRDSQYGRVIVTSSTNKASVFNSNALVFETGSAETEIFTHLAALQHPDPRRILVLGGGWDGTIRELLRHRPVRIDSVVPNLDAESLALLRRCLSTETRTSLANPAVRITRADPRQFLKNSGFAWDLIIVGMPEPSSGVANRFYTREFFAQCAARLHPGGILALRLTAAGSLTTPQTFRRTASIYQALEAVFPEVMVLPAAMTVMTASIAPLPGSPEILADRLRERGLQTSLIKQTYIRDLFADERVTEMAGKMQGFAVHANVDNMPACYSFAVISWIAALFPNQALTELPGFDTTENRLAIIGWILGIGLTFLFFGSRLQPAWRRGLLTAVAGFSGTVSEAVIILAYQAKEGVLYQEIGILIAAFMAGQALGAPLIRDLILGAGIRKKWGWGWGAALIAGFCLLDFVAIEIVAGGVSGGLLLTSGLLAAAGFQVGGLFAYACTYGVRDQKKLIGPLYASTFIGICFGAILGSLALIPLFGFAGTLKGIILPAALALLLI